MMIQGRVILPKLNANGCCVKKNRDFNSMKEADAKDVSSTAVKVKISEAGRKLNQDEKAAGPASAELQEMDSKEKERQRKLKYIATLEERLQDEDLTEKDKEVIQSDIVYLKKETMTNQEKIEALKSEMKEKQKENPTVCTIGYEILIGQIEKDEKERLKKLKELGFRSLQETADMDAEKMKMDEKNEAEDKESKENTLNQVNNSIDAFQIKEWQKNHEKKDDKNTDKLSKPKDKEEYNLKNMAVYEVNGSK